MFHSLGKVRVRVDGGFSAGNEAFKAQDWPVAAGFWVDSSGNMQLGTGTSNGATVQMASLSTTGDFETSGSLIATTGNISGSTTSTGSFGKLEIDGRTTLGNGITSNDGNFQISNSATEPVLNLKKVGQTRARLAVDSNSYVSIGNDNMSFGVGTISSNNAKLSIYTPTTSVHKYAINATDQSANKFTVDVAGSVTASGTVTAGYLISTGYAQVSSLRIPSTANYHEIWNSTNELRIYANQNSVIRASTTDLYFDKNVTAAGNVVASGDLSLIHIPSPRDS